MEALKAKCKGPFTNKRGELFLTFSTIREARRRSPHLAYVCMVARVRAARRQFKVIKTVEWFSNYVFMPDSPPNRSTQGLQSLVKQAGDLSIPTRFHQIHQQSHTSLRKCPGGHTLQFIHIHSFHKWTPTVKVRWLSCESLLLCTVCSLNKQR